MALSILLAVQVVSELSMYDRAYSFADIENKTQCSLWKLSELLQDEIAVKIHENTASKLLSLGQSSTQSTCGAEPRSKQPSKSKKHSYDAHDGPAFDAFCVTR